MKIFLNCYLSLIENQIELKNQFPLFYVRSKKSAKLSKY